MKKKVFFVVSSLGAGGSERVFWLLSQGFCKNVFDVYIVLFNSRNDRLSKDLDNVTIIDLHTIKASRSFYKLYDLIKKEKPYAVFSTAAHLNILIALISYFVKVPFLIGRESNIYHQMAEFGGARGKFLGSFINFFYKRFNTIICQSAEMKESFIKRFTINENKLVIIPNPVMDNIFIDQQPERDSRKKNILIVARLAPEKGHHRLLDIFSGLPNDYFLTIAGDGPLKNEIIEKIKSLNIGDRVQMLGHINNINELINTHNVFALTSYTEGFPNAVLEALAMGIPVVAYKVGGVTELIKPGFNGYIADQDCSENFQSFLINACNKTWDTAAIKTDIKERFGINKITKQYESLIA